MSRAVLSDSASPWTVARQAPLCMGLSRQEYWSGWPSLSPGDLPDPGIGPGSPALQAAPSPSEPRSGVGRCTWTCSSSGGHTPWGLGQHRPWLLSATFHLSLALGQVLYVCSQQL